MSREKYIQETLTLPESMPLFKYNINFDGLRGLLEEVNIKTNQNEEEVKKLKTKMETKLPEAQLRKSEQRINHSMVFGHRSQVYLKQNLINGTDVEQTAWKLNKMLQLIEYVLVQSENHGEQLAKNDQKHEKHINQSFRRLEEKIQGGMESFSKTINSYFSQNNDTTTGLQSGLKIMKINYDQKLNQLQDLLAKKVSQSALQSAFQGSEIKIKKMLEGDLKTDQMMRMNTLNQYTNKLRELEKDVELKQKVVQNKIQQFGQKITKAMQVGVFEIEKHKIYDKLSEFKNKIEDSVRKNQQFVEFRKNYLGTAEKSKQQIISLGQQVTKLSQKGGNFQKMQNVADMLAGLNPHLVCELGQTIKLHEKQIGKLQKQFLNFVQEMKNKKEQKAAPQMNTTQITQMVLKTIKEYMGNMDFQARVKRGQKDIFECKRKTDGIYQLQKKMNQITKDTDMSLINKELKKKCDQENTRRELKILDGKLEQLFEYYKIIRKQIEAKKPLFQPPNPQSVSLTTKRLLSTNCLSCVPERTTRKVYSRNRLDLSADIGLDYQKHTLPVKFNR